MNFKIISFYFTLLVFLAGCMGGGNEELAEATFGIQMDVSPKNQTLEDPATLAQDITVTVTSEDGSPSKGSKVSFKLLNPASGAQLLAEFGVTDKNGQTTTQVIGGDDFGKIAKIKVSLNGTKLSQVINVAIRNKIVPTRVQIVNPPQEIVAGKPFQIALRLVDDNGRVAEDEEFNDGFEVQVTTRSVSDGTNDPSKFNKTASVDRTVTFEEGLGYIQGATYTKAEDVIVELYDHGGYVSLMESRTGKDFRIDDAKTFRFVPDSPVRAQLQDMVDVTTDDAAKAEIRIYDQYDNHAYNFGGVCSFVVSTVGDNADEAYIVDSGDSSLRNKTGIASVGGGVGKFDVRDTNVETATVNIDGINFGCGGISNLGGSRDVDFTVGATAKIVIRQPVNPNDTAKTTEEIALDIEATDAGGNLTPSFSGLIGIDFDGGCSANINNDDEEVADSRNVRAALGRKTIRVYNRYLDRKNAETCTVSLRGTADTVDVADMTSTAVIRFIPGDPKQFSFVNAITNGEVGWGTLDSQRNRITVDVEQLDTWGNPIIEGGNLKSVYVVSDGNSEINNTGNKKLITFNAAGKGDFEFYNTKNETVTLYFLDGTTGMRYTPANSENVSVDNPSPLYTAQVYFKWGIPTQATILPVASGTVDAPLNVNVQMQDYGGNVVQDFGTNAVPRTELKMIVSGNDGVVTLMDDLEFVNGLSTVRARNTKEETVTFSLDKNDGVTSFNNSQGMAVVHSSAEDGYYRWGDAGRKFLIVDPDDPTVDDKATLKIQVVDQYNNPVRDYGCSVETEDITVNVNSTAKVTGDSAFDHTNQGLFDALTQSHKVDIRAQQGSCPLADPASDTFTDASFGLAYIYAREITPYGSDYQQINVTVNDHKGVGYTPSPGSGVNIAFYPGAVAEYRAQSTTGTVDDPIQVAFDAMDQFENKVVTFTGDNAATFRWVFQGSDGDNQAYINLNADGIDGNGDDRVDGDLFIDFKTADRGTGYINLSATVAETIQVGLVSQGGNPVTSAVANVVFKAGVVSQLQIVANQNVNTINTDSKAYFGVRALDQYGNLNEEYDDNNIQVTANKSAKILVNPTELDPNNYVLNTPVPIIIEDGIGEFYAYDSVKETATLSMIDNINRGYTLIPLDVDFLHGNPVQVAIAQINSTQINIPSDMEADTEADAPALVKIQVQDRNGNVADTFTRTGINSVQIDAAPGGVDIDFRNALPTANMIPTDDADESHIVDINNGEGQVYILARKVGSKDIFINPLSTGLNAEPASDEAPVTLNILHGDTAKFGIFETLEGAMPGGTLTNLPNSTINGTTDNNISLTVRAYDYYNNLASTDDSSEVVFSVDKQAFIAPSSVPFGSSLIGVSPYKSVKLNMNGGQAGFEIRDYKKETGITSSLSSPSDPGVDVGHIRPININFGQPHYFAIIKPPVTTTSVDNVYNVTVEVRDQNHNIIENGFTGEVDFEVDGQAFLNTGAQDSNTGLPIAAKEQVKKLEFLAGNPGSATMPVWNRKAETINLSLVAGTGKNLANNASLQVTDLANPSELKTLTFAPGYPDNFQLETPAVADSFGGVDYHSDADNPVTIVAKAYDKYGNYCNNYSEGDAIQISLTAPSNQAYVTTFADPDATSADVLMDFGSAGGFPQGEGRLVIRDKIKENITVTLIDVKADGIDWTANNIVVKNKWGTPKMFHIGTVLGDDPVGNNGPRALRADVLIRVEAISKDDYGNTVLDFNGKADLQVIGQQVFYPEGQTFSGFINGAALLGYEQRKVGTSTIRLVDNVEAPVMRDYQLEGDASRIVNIIPGVPEQFAYIDPLDPDEGNPSLDILAGNDLLVTIEAQDKWGNRANTFDGVGADARVTYAAGTGTIKDAGNNYVTNPVPFVFTGGAATVTLKNSVLDRQVSGPKNEPLKGETVTMGFLSQTDTSAWTADGNPMDYSNTLDITFYPNTPKTLTVVDYQATGPYGVDDPVELRVEARDEFGNYTDEYSGSFNLTVNKNAWAFQGPADSGYKLLPTEDLNGQDTGVQSLAYTITATPNAGWRYVLVADLTSELNVSVGLNSGSGGITTHESTDIGFKHGVGVYYDIVFTDQEGIPQPEFSTDKHRPVEVRVLDKGGNIVLSHPTHDVRIVSDNTISSEFTGDDPADDGKIEVSGGTGQANYLSRDDIVSTLTIDTASPGLYPGVSNSTQPVKFIAGTVAKLVFANPPLSLSADDVLIGEQAYYDANTPACSTSPGQQICPYPTQVFRVEPQDKYGNINEIEGASKRYDVTVIAHESGVPTNTIWSQPVEIVNGTAWLDYDAGTLFTQRLYKAQAVDFKLANPTPASQPDENSNNIVLDFSSATTVNVTPGAATRLWVTQPADGTIDNPIGVTIEVQDAHNIDGNGNGNLVVDAPDITVGMALYAPDEADEAVSGNWDANGGAVGASVTAARNDAYSGGGGYTQKDQRDNQTTSGNDVVSGTTLTIKKGIAVFNIEDLTAEDVVVSLFDTGSGTAEGAGGIYYTPANVNNQSKKFKFDPGVPTRYKIELVDSTGSVYDPVPADKLNVFEFNVKAFDKGNNFTPGQAGWAYVTVDNSGGGHVEVLATPDASEDDGNSQVSLSGTVVKNVKVTNGLGPVQFKAKKTGIARISVTSTSGLIADSNVPEVTINPGPAERIVMIDPSNIRTTLSTDVSDYNDIGKQELSVVQLEGRDYFDNIARDVTGTISLSKDSATMVAIDGANNVNYDLSFTNGFDAIKSLRVRNTVAETVNLDLVASTLKNSNNVNLEIPSDAVGDGNEPQDIVFSPGPEAQVSLEIDDSWANNVKEDFTATDANADNPISMRLRTRDIYGNINNENNWTNEITVQLVPNQGTAVADINDSSDTETLSLTAGEATFDVRLKEFGDNNTLNVADNRYYGQNSGMDWLNVSISSTSGLEIYNAGAGPVKHPRKVFYEAGTAIQLTMDDPEDSTIDEKKTITIYARDQYGNVDHHYGEGGEYVLVNLDSGDATIYQMDETTVDNKAYFTNGVAEVKIGSTRAGLVNITLADDAGSTGTASPTVLNPLVDAEFDNVQDIYYEPGEPVAYIFTDVKKNQFDFVDPASADTTITHTTGGSRINVDSSAVVYMYSVDQGGNITTQLDSNDRFTGSFDKGDASVNTGDSLYGDFVDGEAQFVIEREKSFGTDGLATLELTLQGADIGNIATNKLKVNFDHGKTVKFGWTTPAGDVSIDSIAQFTIRALDQYDNFNDNYAGNVDITGTPNSAITGDFMATGNPYMPTTPGDSSDIDATDLNYTGAGQTLAFSAGQLVIEVMSLRAIGYTMNVTNAEITGDSNGQPAASNETVNFINGSAKYYEIFDPLMAGYDIYDSSQKNIDINKSAVNGIDDLTTDFYGKIGIQALDRGGNRVTGYLRNNAFTLVAYDTEASPSKITEKIDFVLEGGIPYEGNSENTERVFSFNNSPVITVEMRAKLNIPYELRLEGLGSILERYPSTSAGNQKHITFLNGSLAQIAFLAGTPAFTPADQSFQVEIEAQDQFGNKAVDYTGVVDLAIDSGAGIKVPSDVDFPADAVFPPVASQTDGAIEITNGYGVLTGFEYHKTLSTADRTITLYIKEKDLDFDPTPGFNVTSFSHTMLVKAGTPENIVFDGEPVDATVGNDAIFKLRIEDTHGNLCYNIPSQNLTAHIEGLKYGFTEKTLKFENATTEPVDAGGNTIEITNGSQTFRVGSVRSDSVDVTLSNAPGISFPTPTKSFEFLADVPVELVFTANDYETTINVPVAAVDGADAAGNIIAGENHNVYVIARDQYQNLAKSFNGTAEVVSNQNLWTVPATAAASYPVVKNLTFTDGKASVAVASETMTNPSTIELGFGNFTGSATITQKSAKYDVIVDHNDAVKFQMTADNATSTIDDAIRFELKALDVYDNFVDDYKNKNVVITTLDTYAYNPGSATPATDGSQDDVADLKYKAGLAINRTVTTSGTTGIGEFYVGTKKVGAVTMKIESADNNDQAAVMDISETEVVTYTHGEAKWFVIKTPPTNGDVDDPVNVEIIAVDRSKTAFAPTYQVDTNYTNNDKVTVTIDSATVDLNAADIWKSSATPAGAPGDGSASVLGDFNGGTAIVQVRSKKPQDLTLTAAPNSAPGVLYDNNDRIVPFDHGAWDHMAFTVYPFSEVTTDDTFSFTVQAQDQYNNRYYDLNSGTIKVVGVNGTFLAGSSVTGGSGVSIPAGGFIDMSGKQGEATLAGVKVTDSGALLLDGNGQNQQTVTFGFADGTMTVPNPGGAASQQNVIVKHGDVYKYQLLPTPTSQLTVGNDIVQSVRLQDENGNIVWDLTGQDPSVTVKVRDGAGAPNQLKVNGSALDCAGCDHVLSKSNGDFVDGFADITLNSIKSQTLTVSLFDSDGNAVTSVSSNGEAFNYKADVCQRLHFEHNNDWTPADPENLTLTPAERQISGDVDNPITIEIQGTDKYGNLDNTCTKEFTLLGNTTVNAGDTGLIDWDPTYSPGTFQLVGGKKNVSLRNFKGHGTFRIRLEFADEGPSWGWAETLRMKFDHGDIAAIDMALTPKPVGTYNIDDVLPFTFQALDQYQNENDNWAGTIQVYVNAGDIGSGSNPGPFKSGSAEYLTTARTTPAFTNGQLTYNVENWNVGNFTFRMKNPSTVGVDTSDNVYVDLESGSPVTYTMDQAAGLDACVSVNNGYGWPADASQGGIYGSFAGCHPHNASRTTDEIEYNVRAVDKGGNAAITYTGTPSWQIVLAGAATDGARVQNVDGDFASTTNYGAAETAQTSVKFTNGVGSFWIGSNEITYYCKDGHPKWFKANDCDYWEGQAGRLEFTFANCGGNCPSNTYHAWFNPGIADHFEITSGPSPSTLSVDDTFTLDYKIEDQWGLEERGWEGNYDIVGDQDMGCTARYGVQVTNDDKVGFKIPVNGLGCTTIPPKPDGSPNLAPIAAEFTLSSGTVNQDLTFSVNVGPGDPDMYVIGGAASGQVAVMSDGTKYAKVTISVLDQHGNVTNVSNGSVDIMVSSGDNTRVGYDFDGSGAPTSAAGGIFTVSGISSQKDVWIKTDLAGSVQLQLMNPNGAPSVEVAAHEITFIPDVAVKYEVVHHDTGASAATIGPDTYTTVRVQAKDQFDNIATSENNKTVSVTGSGAGVQFNPSSVVTINNGIGTTGIRKVAINQANPPSESMTVGMTAASNGSVDITHQSTFTCTPGAPKYAVVVGSQSNPNVQQSQDTSGIKVDFDLYDQFDNPTKPESGTVTAQATLNQINTTWNSTSTTAATLSWGAGHTIGNKLSRYIKTTLASTNHRVAMASPTGGIQVDHPTLGVRTLNIIHGNPDHWKMNINDMGTIYVNTDQTYAIETYMMDAWDNVCNTAAAAPLGAKVTATVTGTPATSYVIDSSGTATGNNTETTSAGVANSSVRATAKTTLSIQASGGGLAASDPKTLNVRWGSPDHMVWTTFATNKATGDAPDSYIVTMYDAFDNVLTGYSNGSGDFSHLGITPGDVKVTQVGFTPDGAPIGDPSPPTWSPGQTGWSGGTATFTIQGFESAGLFTIQADDLTSGSTAPNKVGSINITPAGATKIWIAPPTGKGIVSQPSDAVVYTMDNFNNFAEFTGTIQLCAQPSGTIPTGRYNDDSDTETTQVYFDNPGQYCKTVNFSNQTEATFEMRVDQNNSFGFGWTETYFGNAGGLEILNTNDHEDFYFQPGDPVKYELVLDTHADSGQPAANLFHSTVDAATRDATHLVTGVKRTVAIKAVDVTGAVASTWGGVATLSLGGDAQFSSESVTVDLTQGTGSFDIYDQFVEDVYLRVVGTSDSSVSVYNQNNSGTACDTCEIMLKVSRSKAQTFKVTAVNNGDMSWPDAATNKARNNHNNDTNDRFDITYEILDEGGARFTEYGGKFTSDPAYYENFNEITISNGIRSGQWAKNYYVATRTPSFQPHQDYSGRTPAGMNTDYDTVYFVHDSPDRIYVYCPNTELVSDTASIATCRMKIKDDHHNGVNDVYNDNWGSEVTNFQGGRIELVLKDNADQVHPNAIVYLDTNDNGVIDANESDASFEPDRGTPKQVDFEAGRSIYYFGIHSAQEGNVEVSMQNGVYNGDKWHTYLGGAANTDIPFDGTTSPIKYTTGSYIDQTVFFQAAPTTDMTMVVTGSDGLVNPSTVAANDEYYEVTITATIANGSTNLNENGYVYLDAQCPASQQVGYLEDVYTSCSYYTNMKDFGSGGAWADTNSQLLQFQEGVAVARVLAEKVGDLRFHLRHPGASSVAFVDNDQVVTYDSNPATKYAVAYNYNTPNSGGGNDTYRLISNGQPNTSPNSKSRFEIRAVDADGRIDIHYDEANVPLTLTCTESNGSHDCSAADITSDIDGNLDGTAGDNTITFVQGRATIDILTTSVGDMVLTASDPNSGYPATVGAQADGSASFESEWPAATQLVELVGNRDETVQGKVIFFYEARDDYDNKAGDFLGSFSIDYDVNDGTLSGSSDGMFFVSGLTSYTMESSKGQAVTATFTDASGSGVDVTGDVDGTPTANQNKYTFVGGKAVGIRVTQQPIGNVKKDDYFEQALIVDVIDADEAVVATGIDSAIGIEVTAHLGASCNNEILDSSVTQDSDANLDKTTSAGTFTWDKLASNTAQAISFKVKDANSRWPGACTTVTNVYEPLIVTADGGVTGSKPGDSVIFEMSGGVPTVDVDITTSTDSTAVFVGSSEPGCDGTTCVKYTPGRSIASDTVTLSDSQTANLGANIVNINMQVEAAEFSFDDGGDPATAWSTSALNQLGSFTNDANQSYDIVVHNSATAYGSGEMTITIDAAEPDMWNLNAVGCPLVGSSLELAPNDSCNVYLTFKADSGLSGPGTYDATITVQGQNGSAEQTMDFQATLQKNLDVQDPDDSYVNLVNGSTLNLGQFTGTDDYNKTFRFKNNGTTASGTLAFTYDEGISPDMWDLVTDNCTGQDLSAGQNCEVVIRFRALNGPDGSGTYDSTIQLVSPVLGTTSLGVRATKN